MPAHDSGRMNGLKRLLGTWRQCRARRRRARLHEFVHMSDRMLADIGVRRADVHAALNGLLPAEHLARTRGTPSWTAPVHRLCPPCRTPSDALAATDLGTAA